MKKLLTIITLCLGVNTLMSAKPLDYPRDHLVKTVPSYPFKGVEKFYNLTEIYKDPKLNKAIVDQFATALESIQPDYIAAPEARALPVWGALLYKTDIPGIFLRKKGKLPGPTLQAHYNTTYSTDTLEITVDNNLQGKTVVIIDDGLTSGRTLLASIELLEKSGAKVVKVFAVINHQYAKRDPKFAPWEDKLFTLFDM